MISPMLSKLRLSTLPSSAVTRVTARGLWPCLLGLWIACAIAIAFYSHLGRMAVPSRSGDWAQHLVWVESDYADLAAGHFGQGSYSFAAKSFMAGYPHWSHWLAAASAQCLDITPVESVQVVSLLALLTLCLVLAARIFFLQDKALTPSGVVISALFLGTCAWIGFGMRGHLVGNFFYAQLVGTAVAMLALGILEIGRPPAWVGWLIVAVFGGLILPNFHLVPAVWFTAAGLLHLLFRRGFSASTLSTCIVVGAANCVLWLRNSMGSMIANSNHNGWFLTRLGQLSDRPAPVLLGLAALLVILLALLVMAWRRQVQSHALLNQALAPYAGLMAICALMTAQSGFYLVLHHGSPYAVLKYSYILAGELALLLAGIRFKPLSPSSAPPKGPVFWPQLLTLLIFFAAQLPFIAATHDQSVLVAARKTLLALPRATSDTDRRYPQFSAFSYNQNYYLAIAIMRIPGDARTNTWLLSGSTGESPFTWPEGLKLDPLLTEDPRLAAQDSSHYAYEVAFPDESSFSPASPLRTDQRRSLPLEITLPHIDGFSLAQSMPAPKGTVLLGFRLRDSTGRVLREGRCLFTPSDSAEGQNLRAEIPLQDLPRGVAEIEFSPVQEYVAWFFERHPNRQPHLLKVSP